MADDDEASTGAQALVLVGKALIGAPAAVVSSTVKVVTRLVGAAGAVPEAWIKGKAQAIKDDTDARTAIVKAVSRAAAKRAAADPAIVDRGLDRWADDLVRHQSNREVVAALTIEEVKQAHSASADNAGDKPADVDEDWLNAFSRFAEEASTERMQRLWARVAAGEIRRPGSFSLLTLRLVSELDQTTAQDFARVFAHVVGDCIPVDDAWKAGQLYMLALRMQARGLFLNGPSQTTRKMTVGPNGFGCFAGNQYGVVIEAKPGIHREIRIIALSPEALELARLLEPADEVENLKKVANGLAKDGIKKLCIQPITIRGPEFVTTGPPVWRWFDPATTSVVDGKSLFDRN